MPLPNIFLFNFQLSPLWGISAAQNKRHSMDILCQSKSKDQVSLCLSFPLSEGKSLPVSQGSLMQTGWFFIFI